MVSMIVFVVLFYNAQSAVIDCDNDSIQGIVKTLVDRTDKLEKTVDKLRKENRFLTQTRVSENVDDYSILGNQSFPTIEDSSDQSLQLTDITSDSVLPLFRRTDRQLNLSGMFKEDLPT